MTEDEFVDQAREAGYSDVEIRDLVDFHKDSGIPFAELPLLERTVD